MQRQRQREQRRLRRAHEYPVTSDSQELISVETRSMWSDKKGGTASAPPVTIHDGGRKNVCDRYHAGWGRKDGRCHMEALLFARPERTRTPFETAGGMTSGNMDIVPRGCTPAERMSQRPTGTPWHPGGPSGVVLSYGRRAGKVTSRSRVVERKGGERLLYGDNSVDGLGPPRRTQTNLRSVSQGRKCLAIDGRRRLVESNSPRVSPHDGS